MGQIDGRGGLAIAEIAFYSPALICAIVVYSKQGLVNIGWLYLNLICILRLIGASVTLYIETQNDYSLSLYETAAITGTIGLTPLLLCLGGMLQRIHRNVGQTGLPQNSFRAIHLILIVALALGIVGGVDSTDFGTDEYKTGRDCAKAGSIVFLLAYLLLALITAYTAATKRSSIPSADNKLMIAGVCALPFLLVRVIYTIASGFSTPSSVFYFVLPNVYVEAFMMFAMEAIVVCFFVWAGLFSPKTTDVARYDHNVEAYGTKSGNADVAYDRQTQTRQMPAGRPERSIGDYRPSRMIRNAIRDRN